MAWASASDVAALWSDGKPLTGTALQSLLDAAYEQCRAYAPSLDPVVLRDAVTVNGSATVTSCTAAFSKRDENRAVTGAGLPAGTTVAYVIDSHTLVMTENATTTGSTVTITLAALDVPESYKAANVYQARDLFTASKRGDTGSDVVGVGDFVIRARPLSAVVKALLRPQGHSMLGFA